MCHELSATERLEAHDHDVPVPALRPHGELHVGDVVHEPVIPDDEALAFPQLELIQGSPIVVEQAADPTDDAVDGGWA